MLVIGLPVSALGVWLVVRRVRQGPDHPGYPCRACNGIGFHGQQRYANCSRCHGTGRTSERQFNI